MSQSEHVELALDLGGAENVRITNFPRVLPEPANVKDRNAFARAAHGKGLNLDDDAVYAIARALVNPGSAASLIRQDLLTTEVVGPVDVSLLTANVLLTELFVLMQPRAGGYPASVLPPEVGGVEVDGDVSPQITAIFDDEDHLREYIIETVVLTRALGQDYASSILSKRISRPGLAHVVSLRFRDESPGFAVLCVRDGITRVVSSWAALYPGLDPHELGEVMAAHLLARKEVRSASASEGVSRSRGRDAFAQSLRGRFIAGMSGGAPSEDAIRVGQTFSVPMQICVGIRQQGAVSVASRAIFDDTVQAIIASVHGEFQPWDQSATQTATMLRALPRAVHAKQLSREIAELAAGSRGVEDVPLIYGDEVPATALWRAVCLISSFTHTDEFAALKQQLRELTGARQISKKRYVSHLATLVDSPWRRAKAASERQARRAWGNGGPIPPSMLPADWEPVPTTNFLSLVDSAEAGDENARFTLAAAGGTALIADKLLLSNTGSAYASGAVPFRADADQVVEGLTHSRFGLCILAHAANVFDGDRQAINSFTEKEIAFAPELVRNTYVVPRPDRADPIRPALDKSRGMERLTQWDVVAASDPERASAEKERRADERAAREESAHARAARQRKAVLSNLDQALAVIKELSTAASVDATLGGTFGDRETMAKVKRYNERLQLAVLMAAESMSDDLDDPDEVD